MGSKKNNLRQIRDPKAHKPKKHTSKGALRRIVKNHRRKRVRITPPIREIRVDHNDPRHPRSIPPNPLCASVSPRLCVKKEARHA